MAKGKFKVGDYIRFSFDDDINYDYLRVWQVTAIDKENEQYKVVDAVYKLERSIDFEDIECYHKVKKVKEKKMPDDITLREICANFLDACDSCGVDERVIDVLIKRVKDRWDYSYWFTD